MKNAPVGKSVYNLFEAVVEPNLIQPTIIYDYPDHRLAALQAESRTIPITWSASSSSPAASS
jgi:lysyl-tRNA synthetase class II